jgi:hypothetical protein
MENITHFKTIQQIILHSRHRALQQVNAIMLDVYWKVGAYVSKQIQAGTWGDKVVVNLADFLKSEDPGLKGFNKRGLYRMVSFYETWSDPNLLTTASSFLPSQIVSTLSPQIQTTDNQ